MPYQLKHPTIVATKFEDLDPEDPPEVRFRQANAHDCQVRDQLVFGGRVKAFTDTGLNIHGDVAWNVRQMIEVRLTMCGCDGLLGLDGKPLFRFRSDGTLDMSVQEFNERWSSIPELSLCNRLHNLALDANPEWDFRPRVDELGNPLPAGASVTG